VPASHSHDREAVYDLSRRSLSHNTKMPLLNDIYTAYENLGQDVKDALRAQLGDAARLNEHSRLCLQFISDLNQVCSNLYL
jgi:hypothetical protein